MNKSAWIYVLVISLILLVCCCGIFILGGVGFLLFNPPVVVSPFPTDIDLPIINTPTPLALSQITPMPTATPQIISTPTPTATTPPTPTFTPPPTATATPTLPPVEVVSAETLLTLEQAIVPINDLSDLARRLQGLTNIPSTLTPPPAPLQVGARDSFWATDTGTAENSKVQATLRYVTPHLYFWIEDGARYNQSDLAALCEAFETQIYPTNREFFGSEWSPGIDGDEHLYILYARNLGDTVAGYFSSADEYPPMVQDYSNGHEMFFINADNTWLDEDFTYGVLAHEFQHMIHWYRDRNESSWLNEGFSELAAFLNGYDVGGADYIYIDEPDMQLTDWPNEGDTLPHYGASFLFVTYFLDRFGEQATQALVGEQANGMASVDAILQQIDATDGLTGQPITADDVFLDWVLTSFLRDDSIGDGRYDYHNYPQAPQAEETEKQSRCPGNLLSREVNQYGVDYIRITCAGQYTLHFDGADSVSLLPADPYSGSYAFWSNKGDDSNMTLTQTFDFSGVTGKIEISYRTWYDLETDYDYLYLEASTDGENWQILTTPSGTDEDPSGNSYGNGYNGSSGDWLSETVDLSRYAGQEVQLRFEYVTDAAVNGEGLLLDDIAISAIDYFTDFETDDGGWEAAGFVRIQNSLPQTFRLALIHQGADTTVEYISLNPDMTADIALNLADGEEAILVVTGVTRFTRSVAEYQFQIK